MNTYGRIFAVAGAVFGWTALLAALGFDLQDAAGAGLTVADVLGRYISSFTILVNLFATVAFTAVALAPRYLRRADLMTPVVGYLLIVVLIYVAEFHGALETTGIRALPDAAIHDVMPLVFGLFWLLVVPKGSLTWRAPFVSLIFPLAYLAYMLARGAITRVYPYPFLDAGALGYGRVAVNSLGLMGVYLVVGTVFTLIDCLLSRFSGPIDLPASRA